MHHGSLSGSNWGPLCHAYTPARSCHAEGVTDAAGRERLGSYWLLREQLARASGIETPTREDLAKPDRKRPKKGSNKDWEHPHDPEARITKMKDGRTHLAHKLEHAVDMETGAVVGLTVQTMDGGDTASLAVTLDEAERRLAEVGAEAKEVVADKGYHSNQTMTGVKERKLCSYVSEPERGRRKWKGKRDTQKATCANHRRIRGNRGKRLLRQRGERVERAFGHMLETGGMRRLHVRGQENIRKRMLLHAAAFNLGLLMRRRFGVGTPRALQGLATVHAALATQVTTRVCAFLAGFEVGHVIHRHGVDDETALEVEAALMDAYSGLTNVAGGVGKDRGAMHAKEVTDQYDADPAVFHHKAVLLNVIRSALEIGLYEATCYAWKINKDRASQAEVVLAIVHGVIKGAFVADEWLKAIPKRS